MRLYINDVFNNYYNMSLKDRSILTSKLSNLSEKNKYDAGYTYDYGEVLYAISCISYYTFKGQNFKNFYDKLSPAQKKELQTQIYINAAKVKSWIWYDVPKEYERLKDLYKPEIDFPKEEKELFTPDFKMIKEEFDNCDLLFNVGYSSEKIVSTFCRRFYSYPTDNNLEKYNFTEEEKEKIQQKYINPVLSEFNNAIKDSISVVEDNVNNSTREMFDSLEPIKQLYTMFTILSLSKEKLEYIIINRKREKARKLEEKSKRKTPSEYEIKEMQKIKSKKRKTHTKMKEIKKVNSGYCY